MTNDAAELEQLDQLPPSVVLIDALAEVVEAAEPVVEAETVAAEDAVHSTQAVAHSPSIPAIAVTPSEEHKELPASGAADVEPELASFGDVAVPQVISLYSCFFIHAGLRFSIVNPGYFGTGENF